MPCGLPARFHSATSNIYGIRQVSSWILSVALLLVAARLVFSRASLVRGNSTELVFTRDDPSAAEVIIRCRLIGMPRSHVATAPMFATLGPL